MHDDVKTAPKVEARGRELKAQFSDEERVEKLVSAIEGISPAQWCRIRIAVDKAFDAMQVRLRLTDVDRLKSILTTELKS